MPAFVNWILRLVPTNPIVLRLLHVGSRQMRHLYIRSGYLALMIVMLLFVLLGQGSVGTLSLRDLAGAGANMFTYVSYLQVLLICLLTPVFMAGAIAQEANPRTWEILLTTPLNNLQIVLGNLFGRLVFVLALLFSSLPLFVMTQYFGGVPPRSIFASYAIAGSSATIVAAIAVTLSVTRTAGKRAVFLFYAAVVMYLFTTFALDRIGPELVTGATGARYTSAWTPLNPFLALRVLLESNVYQPHTFTGVEASWLVRQWMGAPIATFCWLCVLVSLVLVVFSTLRLRIIGARVGTIPWYRRMFGLGLKGAAERDPRPVGQNPIVWRESIARGRTLPAMLARWGFVAFGVLVAIALLTLYHVGSFDHATFRIALAAVLSAELLVIALAALNMSATAVSREREDGSLDIILTTPIQPGPYLWGKLVGLMQYLVPMILVPTITLGLVAIYVLMGGLGRENGVMETGITNPVGTGQLPPIPVLLPESALLVPLMFVPFLAFCVMVGLQWSIKSKGTIGSVIAAVGLVLVVTGVLTLCGQVGGESMTVVGGALAGTSPLNLLLGFVNPAATIPSAIEQSLFAGRMSLAVGAALAAVAYAAISFGMHANMKRTFMMTVRRLAGTS